VRIAVRRHSVGLCLLAAAVLSSQGFGGDTSPVVTLNKDAIPEWDLPSRQYDNWQFYPIEWQLEPLSRDVHTDFALETAVQVGDYTFQETPFDTAHYPRYMSMVQFHFQGGLVFRYAGPFQHYRLQFSVKEKTVALWKAPGNFLAAVDYPLEKNTPIKVKLTAIGPHIAVSLDGKEVLQVTDRFSPVLAGRLLAGANHARISVTAPKVSAATPETGAPMVEDHEPRFSLRNWCGYRWVFDGDEPVARLGDGKNGKNWGWHPIALYSAKLRPGTRAADYVPFTFHSKEIWPDKPIAVVKASAGEVTLRAQASDRTDDKDATTRCVSDITLSYDNATDAYVYDVEMAREYLTTRTFSGEILDPFPYWICGPAHSQARQWYPSPYEQTLWRADDGKFYRYPLTHIVYPIEGRLDPAKPFYIFSGPTEVNPTYEILDAKAPYKIGLCAVMIDMHTQRVDVPKQMLKGTKEKARWRITSTHGAALDAIRAGAGHHPMWDRIVDEEAAVVDPDGTTFSADQVVSPLDYHPGQPILPFQWYDIDKEVGRTDQRSLRLDLTKEAGRSVTFVEGSAPFGRAFDGTPLVFRAHAKTVDLEGDFRITLHVQGGAKISSAPLSGTSDGWQAIELLFTPRAEHHTAKVSLTVSGKKGGKGAAWVDDISIRPPAAQ